MAIDLKKYMNDRDDKRKANLIPGPVVTISRQYGCRGTDLAREYIKAIAKEGVGKRKKKPWQIINKEILTIAAEDLKLTPTRVKQSVEHEELTPFQEIFSSLSQQYGVTDKTIHEDIHHILTNVADEGRAVIIGRGGVCVTDHIKRSLNIKLMAPIDWRIEGLVKRKKITKSEAKALIEDMDPKRDQWNERMSKGEFDDSYFDIIFNRALMSDKEILDAMINLSISRDLI